MIHSSATDRGPEGEVDSQVSHYSASGKSLRRHLEPWRRRYIKSTGGLLLMGSTAASAKKYCLVPETLKRHHYAPPGQPHTLSVCCLHGESGQEMEVKFSFKSGNEMQLWWQVFEAMLEALGHSQQRVLLDTVKSVSDYLHNRNDPRGAESPTALDAALPGMYGEDEDGFEVVEDPTAALIRRMYRRVSAEDGRPREEEGPGAVGCLSRAVLRSRLRPYWSLPIPKMRVLIMTVGTRGDVQPFILLGKRLQRDGHRVRLATHESFRDFVCKDNGLEFYPLGGDPQWLSQFMVKTKGFLLPTTMETIAQVPKNVAMVNDIIHSCWGACIYPDPRDPEKKPFIADAIISNPVTYGHVHCAEALGVPLHLMFPQPWVPTKAFPHPMSGMKYRDTEWSSSNYLSYQTVDGVMWQSFLPYINNFRVNTLKLEPIRFLEKTWDLLNYHKVPFVKMWSRFLAPKPKDWPDHIDIVGAFVHRDSSARKAKGIKITTSDDKLSDEKHGHSQPLKREPDPLEAFLNAPDAPPPIFVGFGSMVVDKPEQLIKTMLEGAAIADVRILVQSGWSDINQEWFLRTSEGIERRYNKSSAFHSSTTSSKPPSSVQKDVDPEDDSRSSPLHRSILGAISQTMGVESSSESSGGDSGVLWRQRKESDDNSKSVKSSAASADASRDEDLFSLPGTSGGRSSRWRASDALLIGNYPHDKLFPRVAAVVHHGGAGTTAGGLIAGKPTFICPFFGDQNFWGEMVYKAGFGPAPCLVEQLTPKIVAEKFVALLSPDVQSRARKVSVDMEKEGDGVEMGLQAFYRNLPIENMICDVSLMRHEVRLAQVYCKTCGLKMARNVSDFVHAELCPERPPSGGCSHDLVPCAYVDWSLPPPGGVVDGVIQGAGALAHETLGAIADAFTDPLKGAYYGGIQGGIQGVYSGFRSLAVRPMEGTRVMYSKVSEGMKSGGYTSKSSRSSKDVETRSTRSGSEGSTGAADVEVAVIKAGDDDDDAPEQAARWYGEASMIQMSSSAQARADRSFLFSEEDQNGLAAAGTKSIIHHYGAQAIMESTIIEELDNVEYDSVEEDYVEPPSTRNETGAPSRSIVLSDGTVSPHVLDGEHAVDTRSMLSLPNDADSTLPSISGILENLDSTNAAIRRYSANRSVILAAASEAHRDTAVLIEENDELATLRRSLSAVSIVSSEDEEVQSIVDDDDQESDTVSVVLNSTEETSASIMSNRQYCGQAVSASICDTSVVMRPHPAGISVDKSLVLPEGVLTTLHRRSLTLCHDMALQLQYIMSSVTCRDEMIFRKSTVADFNMLVSAAATRSPAIGHVTLLHSSLPCGRLLSAAPLLHDTLKRRRQLPNLTDVIFLYLQEEMPASVGGVETLSSNENGLSSMCWAHAVESETVVWII